MKLSLKGNKALIPFIVFLVILFDQVSKRLAGNFIEVACNQDAVFGLNIAGDHTNSIITLISLAILIYLVYIISTNKLGSYLMPASFILGGGISNFIDRAYLGCVRDFIIVFDFLPSFNLADTAISIGVGMFLFTIINSRKTIT